MQSPRLIALLCLPALTLPLWAQEGPLEKAANIGFEQVDENGLPVDWIIWPNPLPEPECVSVATDFAYAGERSLRIRHSRPTSYSRADQVVTITPHRQYVITAWMMGDDIKPGDGAMGARLYIGNEGDNSLYATEAFFGTFEWRRVEIGPFDSAERTWIKLIPYLHQSTGTVWFDDISVRELTDEEIRGRAQARARNRALTDLAVAGNVAAVSGGDLLAQVGALRETIEQATDLPERLDPKSGPPYFPLHEEALKLMARANAAQWPAGQGPAVYARWEEPFSPVAAVQSVRPAAEMTPCVLDMLRQEKEPACIRLTSLSETSQTVTVSLPDLRTATGATIPADRVLWRQLRYVETRDGQLIGDPLVRVAGGFGGFGLALPAGITQDLWLIVDSAGVDAGRYEGTVRITCADGASQDLPLTVTVHPVDFPDEIPMHTFAYAYTTWELLSGRTQQSRQDLIDHRINTYVIHGAFTPWPRFDEKGDWQGLNWDPLDQQIALHPNAKCLLLWPGLEIGERLAQLAPPGGPAYPSEEWAQYAARWAKELAEGMKARGFGYDRWALYLVDEPSGIRAQIVRASGDAVRRGDPLIRIFENPYGAASARDMELMAPVVDIWCPMLNTAKDERLDFCRENAQEVWMYQVLAKASDPLTVFRLAFWEAFEKDLRGYGFWDYADCGGSVWDAWDSDRHDYAVVYDGDETELTPSRRWEAYREGAEDHTMLSMLSARSEQDRERALALAKQVREAADAQTLSTARRQVVQWLAQ